LAETRNLVSVGLYLIYLVTYIGMTHGFRHRVASTDDIEKPFDISQKVTRYPTTVADNKHASSVVCHEVLLFNGRQTVDYAETLS